LRRSIEEEEEQLNSIEADLGGKAEDGAEGVAEVIGKDGEEDDSDPEPRPELEFELLEEDDEELDEDEDGIEEATIAYEDRPD
jgi:hypothetical protein